MKINHITLTGSATIIIAVTTSSTLFSTKVPLWNRPQKEAQASFQELCTTGCCSPSHCCHSGAKQLKTQVHTSLWWRAQNSYPVQLPHADKAAFGGKENLQFCVTCVWNSANFVCLGDWGAGRTLTSVLFMNECANDCNLNGCTNFEDCILKQEYPLHHDFHVWMDAPPFLPPHAPVI